jgi:hypothetical protein
MKSTTVIKGIIAILATAMASVCWGSGPVVTFSGRATAVNATVLGINTLIGDTGPLPKTGGAYQTDLAAVTIPLLLSGTIAQSDAVGVGDHTTASSTIAGLNLLYGAVSISADLIQSQAYVEGANQQDPTATGSSLIANLVINGQAIVVTGKPNQKIKLPGVEVIINEQKQGTGKISVTALQVSVLNAVELSLASSSAGVGPCGGCGTHTCNGTPNCGNQDFLIGSGLIPGSLGGVANFGLELNNTSNFGGFVFEDVDALTTFVASTVSNYQIISPVERKILGTGQLDGLLNVNYVLDVVENGSTTTFTLTLSSGSEISGNLNLGFLEIQQACNN